MSTTRPSRSRRRRDDLPPPDFFIDRSLGRHEIPDALRSWGYTARTVWDVYGIEREQTLDDEVWIRDSAVSGWVCLTWDYLRSPRRLRPAIAESRAKVFRIGREANNAATQVAWLQTNIHRIIQRSRRDGGWIWVVRERRIEPYWP